MEKKFVKSVGTLRICSDMPVPCYQGTHGTGKAGKMTKKNPCQGKHNEFGHFAKTQEKHREFCLLKL